MVSKRCQAFLFFLKTEKSHSAPVIPYGGVLGCLKTQFGNHGYMLFLGFLISMDIRYMAVDVKSLLVKLKY